MKGRQAEPRDDISPPPAGEVLWEVSFLERRTVLVRARTAFAAAQACGVMFSEADVRRLRSPGAVRSASLGSC